MASILAKCKSVLRLIFKKRQAQIVVPDASAWPVVWGYAPWIEEVWANYISNAIKYGGTPPRIELGATPLTNGQVRFWVRDNGPGLRQRIKRGCSSRSRGSTRCAPRARPGAFDCAPHRRKAGRRRSAWKARRDRAACSALRCPLCQLTRLSQTSVARCLLGEALLLQRTAYGAMRGVDRHRFIEPSTRRRYEPRSTSCSCATIAASMTCSFASPATPPRRTTWRKRRLSACTGILR